MRAIPGGIAKQEQDICRFEQKLAAARLTRCSPAVSTTWPGRNGSATPTPWPQKWNYLYRLRTEPYRRWALGFSCFFFVWAGAPMAMCRRHGDPLGSFFLCFLPILIVYYPLMVFGLDGSKHGTIPPWSNWAGNALLAVGGLFLLRRVLRY